MSIVVQKFGGTSVADSTRIKNVANAVIREYNNGNQVVVVVSAMGKTTDYLVKLAGELAENPNHREMDMLLSTGEQVSIALLSMAIQAAGCPAISLLASQIGIITEGVHTKARILDIKTDKMKKHLDEGKIIVAAGFQGVTTDGEITTLGRGGSDTTAVALAAALKADRCDIYTDVDAIYTADPRQVPAASRLDTISYSEMLELARVGAKVLHPRSVETAKQYNVPLRLRSSFNLDDPGTLVIGDDKMEIYRPVTGVAADLKQVRIAVLRVPDQPGIAAKIFSSLAADNISVDMIIQSLEEGNLNNIAFTVNDSDLKGAINVLERVKLDINAGEVVVDGNIAKVSLVGAGMVDRPGIAAGMFEAMAEAGINIKMIATSEIKISCLVDKDQAEEAIRSIHRKFDLDAKVEMQK
ncbi:MAG: aspartate kinase [Candidatus Melainabacteria bacterium GWF2_37_15]|nr:MAG: aspartate kinase [Candidatus Melainabacteria bacterium GWF2_37_15]